MDYQGIIEKAFMDGVQARTDAKSFMAISSLERKAKEYAEQRVNLFAIPAVSVSLQREQLAKDILLSLLQNPERYKYIAKQVESGKLKQEEANLKNINKAYKIADSFLSVWANEH